MYAYQYFSLFGIAVGKTHNEPALAHFMCTNL